MIKYIGQHIFDFIARFRSDVYLEDIADGTVASDKFLGLDSNNKIVKETVSMGAASTVTVTDSTANTNFPVVFHDEATAASLLDDTGTLIYNPSTGLLTTNKLTVSNEATFLGGIDGDGNDATNFATYTASTHFEAPILRAVSNATLIVICSSYIFKFHNL